MLYGCAIEGWTLKNWAQGMRERESLLLLPLRRGREWTGNGSGGPSIRKTRGKWDTWGPSPAEDRFNECKTGREVMTTSNWRSDAGERCLVPENPEKCP